MMALDNKISVSWFLVVASVLVVGCSKSDNSNVPEEKAELTQIHEIYMIYVKNNQAPPKQFADINQKSYSEVHPLAFNAVKDGKYVVVWGVNDKSSGTLLAYEKDAPAQGGTVLMADGTIKKMSADEVQAAIKK
jgi:protein-disulfide isomerase